MEPVFWWSGFAPPPTPLTAAFTGLFSSGAYMPTLASTSAEFFTNQGSLAKPSVFDTSARHRPRPLLSAQQFRITYEGFWHATAERLGDAFLPTISKHRLSGCESRQPINSLFGLNVPDPESQTAL